MTTIEMTIKIAGFLTLGLSLFHIPIVWQQFFPRWQIEMSKLNQLHQKLINTILIALSMILVVFAIITIIYSTELLTNTGISHGLLISLTIFWMFRAIWQIVYFPPSKIEHTRMLLFLNYSVVVVSLVNSIIYCLPLIF